MAETESTSEGLLLRATVRLIFFISLGMDTPQLAVCQEPVSISLPLLVNEVINVPGGTQTHVDDFAFPLLNSTRFLSVLFSRVMWSL